MSQSKGNWIGARLFRQYCHWRHTRGFGVHSPFAFRLVTEAIRPSRGYAYYSELEPGMSAIRRIQYRVDIFMRQAAGMPLTSDFEEWLENPSLPLMILSPDAPTTEAVASRLRSGGCGLLISSPRYLIAIARPEMAFVSYDLL